MAHKKNVYIYPTVPTHCTAAITMHRQITKDMVGAALFLTALILCVYEDGPLKHAVWLFLVSLCAVSAAVDGFFMCTQRLLSVACFKDMVGGVGLAAVAAAMFIYGESNSDRHLLAVFFSVALYVDVMTLVSHFSDGLGNPYRRYHAERGQGGQGPPAADETGQRVLYGGM